MRKTWTRSRRRFLAAALVTLAAATSAAPATASTSSRLKKLEDKVKALEDAKATLNQLHSSLSTTQGQFNAAYQGLAQNYNGLIGCLRRTPLFSYNGYFFDRAGTTINTTGLDWFVSGGVVPSGVVGGTNAIHALSLANTPGCLAYATFRNPITNTAALTGATGKGPAG